MDTRLARRTIADIRSVYHAAPLPATAHWLTALIVRMPECAGLRSLAPADRAWAHTGARFRTVNGVTVSLPPGYTAGAREMYCRNVYLRAGLSMPTSGWVVDLGANRGLFSIWAAMSGAHVVAVEAQLGFAAEIRRLAAHNGVAGRVNVEIAMAGGGTDSGSAVGILADDRHWSTCSHGAPERPTEISMPQVISKHDISRIGLLKMDIEGSEFAVLGSAGNLAWLKLVDQLVLEVHQEFGNAAELVRRVESHGFAAEVRDADGRRVGLNSSKAGYAYFRRT